MDEDPEEQVAAEVINAPPQFMARQEEEEVREGVEDSRDALGNPAQLGRRGVCP